MQPKLLNVNRTPSQPKKRKKITLVFDENKRREFLTGFRKRKLQRKQKAKEDLQQRLKEERKRIKQEEKYETEGHTISILELNTADLAEKNTLIGENKDINEMKSDEEEESDGDSRNNEEIVGMPLNEKKQPRNLRENSKENFKEKQIENRKDLKKAIKRASLKQVKMERQKNKKESIRKRRRVEKAKKRSGKLKRKSDH
ncbi:Nucleolar protein 12 [Melipona quadrifasciata]|uniref:Nucleolar protein 12 n=1 Tax=Melipona quadrifasciata TaxID=166423 RepID=A0A0N0BII3_9HYME|nr:Nucleolar protein 12 [Melipona quadrifasciata]